jgi:hypothetical protein
MQRRPLATAAAFLLITATGAAAQQYRDCRSLPDLTAQDICQKSQDLFDYMAPQLGTAIAGGNATLGQGGPLGFGHVSVGMRGNVVQGSVPQIKDVRVSQTGIRQDTYPTKSQYLPFPAVDAAIGLFPGLDIGVTSLGAVDALVSAYYATPYQTNGVRLGVEGTKLKLGLGARVGILRESPVLPGLSVTYFRRDLPMLDIAAAAPSQLGAATSDTLGVQGLTVKTTAWRVVASKSVLIIGLAAGAGRDTYNAGAVLRGAHGTANIDAVPFSFAMTRTNYFADMMLNLAVFKVVGEVGRVSGGALQTFNQFQGIQPAAARNYGSVGIRLGW